MEIDNGHAERVMKPTALGRENWLFFGSDRGGRTFAILNSFTYTGNDLGIDRFGYLRDVFERISGHPMHRLDELLADRWLAARTCREPDTAIGA